MQSTLFTEMNVNGGEGYHRILLEVVGEGTKPVGLKGQEG